MIIVVDYGMGNLGSISNMLKKAGAKACVSSAPGEIAAARGIILPGVGAFDAGMRSIRDRGLLEPLSAAVPKAYILGICLGMQLLMERSEEGSSAGLGWVKGSVVRFGFSAKATGLKIPHMGWNELSVRREDPLVAGMDARARFYFVHSYHVLCDNPNDAVATTHHGYDFPSVIRHGNVFGTQFHPEKSHRFGMLLLSNFAEMVRSANP